MASRTRTTARGEWKGVLLWLPGIMSRNSTNSRRSTTNYTGSSSSRTTSIERRCTNRKRRAVDVRHPQWTAHVVRLAAWTLVVVYSSNSSSGSIWRVGAVPEDPLVQPLEQQQQQQTQSSSSYAPRFRPDELLLQQQSQQEQQQPPPQDEEEQHHHSSSNLLEQVWHHIQQRATSMHRSPTSSTTPKLPTRIRRQAAAAAAENGEDVEEVSSSTTTAATATTATTQQQQQQHPAENSLAQPTRARRRALYHHALQEHYRVGSHTHTNNHNGGNSSRTVDDGTEPPFRSNTFETESILAAAGATYGHGMGRPTDPKRPNIDRTTSLSTAFPPFPPSRARANRALIQSMFRHGYDSYMTHGYPSGEVHPISCQAGTFDLIQIPALTLIDSLGAILVVLGNDDDNANNNSNVTEFARSCERLRQLDDAMRLQQSAPPLCHQHHNRRLGLFDLDQNVSVFETNIRILGGLLSAHQLALAMQLHRSSDKNDTTTIKTLPPPRNRVLQSHVWTATGEIQRGPPPRNSDKTDATNCLAEKNICWIGEEDDDEDLLVQQPDGTAGLCCLVPLMVLNRGGSFDSSDRHIASLNECNWATWMYTRKMTANHTSTATSSQTAYGDATSNPILNDDGDGQVRQEEKEEDHWVYDGFLLELAVDIGTRLLSAFDTPTGIPYGTVHLQYGVPLGETPIASLAGGGTLSLEFELLSRLSGDERFGKAAKLATRALSRHRSENLNLLGKHIDTRTGSWTETLSGIGSNSDSFIEYLAKHYMLFPEDDDFWIMLQSAYAGIFDESRLGEWYADVDMNHGTSSGNVRRVLESLAAFYPGMQVLLGEIAPAARSLNSFFMVRELLGFLPERFNYGIWNLDVSREGSGKHPLRPELLESCYFMHRASRNLKSGGSIDCTRSDNNCNVMAEDTDPSSGWQWAADFALHKLERVTRAECGYASLSELKPQTTGSVNSSIGVRLMDEMPSYFLSETLKYLYLTFDEDNLLHRDDDRQWIFTTEAHPIHNVPRKKTSSSLSSTATHSVSQNEFTNDVEALQSLMRGRVFEQHRPRQSSSTSKNRKHNLVKEKWSTATDRKSYQEDINTIAMHQKLRRNQSLTEDGSSETNVTKASVMADWLTAIVPPGPNLMDVFRETAMKSNVAHLSLGNWGSGRDLQKACHNVYNSDLLWMQALNGGATDYSDSYVSVGHDALIDQWQYFTLLGAADALGTLGTGVYFGENDNEALLCPVAQTIDINLESGTVGKEGTPSIISDVGSFDVTSFPDGNGFEMQHLDSGELLKVSVVFDEVDTKENVAMVYSELREGDATQEDGIPNHDGVVENLLKRQVSIADFKGNSFSCEIELFRYDSPANYDDALEFSTIPCSTSLFGPSQMSLLKKQEVVMVEAILLSPSTDNRFGCNSPLSSSGHAVPDVEGAVLPGDFSDISEKHVDATLFALIVHRGDCSFFAKATNAKTLRNAPAVIIVNNVGDEVFMMSSGDDELKTMDPTDIPLTVLISGTEGEDLLQELNKNSNKMNPIVARIALKRRRSNVGSEGELNSELIQWPVVRGNDNTLEILVKHGWGVRGVQVENDDRKEWQLHLLRHGSDVVATT